ncbi:uncharacterized protein LOC127882202 [Dreissena polymorpha]|nr:uncharacterized protein LOC127882202 [Dreissena polymorpha]
MSLYKCVWVFVLASATVKGIVYLGCYMDNTTKRVLPHALADERTNNTPGDCARRCSNYRYAGVEYWWECFCGNILNANEVPEEKCSLPCPGNNRIKCGGFSRISIYTNWECGPPPTIANGNATLRNSSHIAYGSIADVYCDSGFISKPTITCLSNTSWEKATCEQQALYIGVGVAVGLVCAVGAVIVIIVLRRRGSFACKKGKNTDTNDTSTVGSLTLAIRSHGNEGENNKYCVQSVEGNVDHYNSADEPNEGNRDTDHYYSNEVTEQTYDRMKDGNDEYDLTTNTVSSEFDTRKRENIYNKLKTDQHGDYDHFARSEHNMSRTGNDYDTTYLASKNDGIGDYNHVVSATIERVNCTKDREQGGYDFLHGIKTKLPPCDDTDYAHTKI